MQIVNSQLDINRRYWYVMGAYRFEENAEEFLGNQGIETFCPKEIVFIKKPHRRPIAVQKPVIPTLIYVHSSREELAEVKKHINSRIKYITTTVDGHLDFLVVPDGQMQAFIYIWQQRDVYNASLSTHLLQPGTPVRIISGPMSGITGTLIRHLKPRPLSSNISQPSDTAAATAPAINSDRSLSLTSNNIKVPHSRISLRLANLLAITLDIPTASLEPIK